MAMLVSTNQPLLVLIGTRQEASYSVGGNSHTSMRRRATPDKLLGHACCFVKHLPVKLVGEGWTKFSAGAVKVRQSSEKDATIVFQKMFLLPIGRQQFWSAVM